VNYYSFHVGDYASHTRHLTLLGDLAYRRLIDHYYLTERPLPADPAECARLIGMRDQIQEVSEVLSDFFLKSDAGWINKRCEKEINKYHAKADRARSANQTRWACDPPLKSDGDQIPTKNQEPRTKKEQKPPIAPQGGENGSQASKPKTKAVTLKTFLAECGESGEAPIPEDDPVFAYAEKVGLPERFLHLAWGVFQSKYVNTSQRQSAGRGWRQKFRNAVEGNWGKLWYMNGSGWELTTAGKQAELAHGDES
jgi:uncharacterized protein YdaU (DUF1376 family)